VLKPLYPAAKEMSSPHRLAGLISKKIRRFPNPEIGPLRDPRFVYPALKSVTFEERLRGVAGLAFLWSDCGRELLRQVALNGPESAVRLSVFWAYGFAGVEDAEELLLRQAECDSRERAPP
jgi:hypothetical protein